MEKQVTGSLLSRNLGFCKLKPFVKGLHCQDRCVVWLSPSHHHCKFWVHHCHTGSQRGDGGGSCRWWLVLQDLHNRRCILPSNVTVISNILCLDPLSFLQLFCLSLRFHGLLIFLSPPTACTRALLSCAPWSPFFIPYCYQNHPWWGGSDSSPSCQMMGSKYSQSISKNRSPSKISLRPPPWYQPTSSVTAAGSEWWQLPGTVPLAPCCTDFSCQRWYFLCQLLSIF